MVENSDRYCKIIAGSPEERKKAYSVIGWIGKVAAERLMDAPYLDIYIVKSTTKNMDHCAIVKCPFGVLYAIPRTILQPVAVKLTHSSGIDRDVVMPEEEKVTILSDTEDQKNESFSMLAFIGDQTAHRLIGCDILILRKKRSGIKGLEDHSVIQCPLGYLYPVPVRILKTLSNA